MDILLDAIEQDSTPTKTSCKGIHEISPIPNRLSILTWMISSKIPMISSN